MKYILTKDKRPFKVIEIDITGDTLIEIHINGLVYLSDKIDGKRIVIHRFNDLNFDFKKYYSYVDEKHPNQKEGCLSYVVWRNGDIQEPYTDDKCKKEIKDEILWTWGGNEIERKINKIEVFEKKYNFIKAKNIEIISNKVNKEFFSLNCLDLNIFHNTIDKIQITGEIRESQESPWLLIDHWEKIHSGKRSKIVPAIIELFINKDMEVKLIDNILTIIDKNNLNHYWRISTDSKTNQIEVPEFKI